MSQTSCSMTRKDWWWDCRDRVEVRQRWGKIKETGSCRMKRVRGCEENWKMEAMKGNEENWILSWIDDRHYEKVQWDRIVVFRASLWCGVFFIPFFFNAARKDGDPSKCRQRQGTISQFTMTLDYIKSPVRKVTFMSNITMRLRTIWTMSLYVGTINFQRCKRTTKAGIRLSMSTNYKCSSCI